jgi:putative Holliday junction resolvase
MELLAVPHTVITERNTKKLAERIVTEAQAIGAELIVVGNPLNMNGSAGPRSQKCAALAELLSAMSGLPAELVDERSTTVSAVYYLNQTDVRGKKRKSIIDAVAAVIILEQFLNVKKEREIS